MDKSSKTCLYNADIFVQYFKFAHLWFEKYNMEKKLAVVKVVILIYNEKRFKVTACRLEPAPKIIPAICMPHFAVYFARILPP